VPKAQGLTAAIAIVAPSKGPSVAEHAPNSIRADAPIAASITSRIYTSLTDVTLVEDLQRWLQEHLPRLPGWSDLAKAMRYALAHWDGLILYLDDGRLEMDTNVVERAIRPVTITRKNSLFAGSDAGARRWAIANTLIQTAKLSGVEPLAYLTDALQRIVSGQTKSHELHALLPWNWRPPSTIAAA
jgi:transposase